MISKATWQVIIDAVAAPRSHLRGTARRNFRAAVELAVEQICNHILGADVRSPDQMALGLNRWIRSNATHKNAGLARAVVKVIADYRIIQAAGSPEDDKYVQVIEGSIMKMINLIPT